VSTPLKKAAKPQPKSTSSSPATPSNDDLFAVSQPASSYHIMTNDITNSSFNYPS
jgi:hypothetical protein